MIDNKGQVGMILGVMLFVFAIAAMLAFTAPLKLIVENARDASHLDCDNASAPWYVSSACVGVDLTLPMFLLTVIGVGATMIIKGAQI